MASGVSPGDAVARRADIVFKGKVHGVPGKFPGHFVGARVG